MGKMKIIQMSRRWYVSLIAGFYLVVCMFTLLNTLAHLDEPGFSMPWEGVVVCVLALVFSVTYFGNAFVGSVGLGLISLVFMLVSAFCRVPDAAVCHGIFFVLILIYLVKNVKKK